MDIASVVICGVLVFVAYHLGYKNGKLDGEKVKGEFTWTCNACEEAGGKAHFGSNRMDVLMQMADRHVEVFHHGKSVDG